MIPWSLNKTIRLLICFVVLNGFFPFEGNAQEGCSFRGDLDFAQDKFNVRLDFADQAVVTAEWFPQAKNEFYFRAKIDHLKFSFLDISTILESAIKLVQGGENLEQYYLGSVRSQYSLIDYKPVPELSGNFEIKNGKLIIQTLQWGGVHCQGYLGLLPPHDLALTIRVEDIKSNDFFKIIGLPEEELKVSGYITGVFRISGFLDRAIIRGRIESGNGVFADLEYDNIILNFEVVYPFIRITDSIIAQTNGLTFQMEGAINLTHRDVKTVQEELARLKMSPIVDESMGHREWTIKRRTEEGSSSMTEFKYRLQKRDQLQRPLTDQSDILGIERRMKF